MNDYFKRPFSSASQSRAGATRAATQPMAPLPRTHTCGAPCTAAPSGPASGRAECALHKGKDTETLYPPIWGAGKIHMLRIPCSPHWCYLICQPRIYFKVPDLTTTVQARYYVKTKKTPKARIKTQSCLWPEDWPTLQINALPLSHVHMTHEQK